MVDAEQIGQWRAQLSGEPSSFARDLATVLLLELERQQREVAHGHTRFAATQASVIRATLLTSPPLCAACRDAALRAFGERLRAVGSRPERVTSPGA